MQAVPGFRVAAVGTTRTATAQATAQRFGVPHAFADPQQLVSHPDVDLVTVAVKVPEHDRLVRMAIEAGKHVYCEFPLGRTTEEAAAMLRAAEAKGVRHFVGLQARVNPALAYVKDLIGATSAIRMRETSRWRSTGPRETWCWSRERTSCSKSTRSA